MVFYWCDIGDCFGVFSIFSYFQEKKPEVTYRIIAEADIFSINKGVPDLHITFKGEDLQKSKRNLKIVTIEISNTGNDDILQGYYDIKGSWGLKLENCDIFGNPKLVNSTSEYLKNNINPKVSNSNILVFEKVIFEKGQAFVVELKTLVDSQSMIKYSPIGKIAKVGRQHVLERNDFDNQPTIFGQIFMGGILVNLLRFIICFICILVLFALFVSIIEWIAIGRLHKKEELEKIEIKTYLNSIIEGKSEKEVDDYIDIYHLIVYSDDLKKDIVTMDRKELIPDLNEIQTKTKVFREKYDLNIVSYPVGCPFLKEDDSGNYSIDRKKIQMFYEINDYVKKQPLDSCRPMIES
ncbi:hypothetical protein KAJ27_06705 [bacterium]|nr:hypothetical protein [bacterium]